MILSTLLTPNRRTGRKCLLRLCKVDVCNINTKIAIVLQHDVGTNHVDLFRDQG